MEFVNGKDDIPCHISGENNIHVWNHQPDSNAGVDRIRNGQRYVLFGDAFLKFPISYLLQDDCMALINQTSEVVAETATPLWLACIAYIMNILFGDQSMVMRTTVILLKDL